MYETVVLSLGLVWVVIGLTLSLFMGRRGHLAFGWFVLGTLMGPMAVILAVAVRRHPEDRPSRELAAPGAASGEIDVLVGTDGSPESFAAFDSAATLLGSRLGRVTFATVLPYEAGRDDERRATRLLETAVERSGCEDAGTELLHGRPSEVLVGVAARDGYELVVVGKRGAGLAKRLLGSTAAELARDAKVPVLIPGE